MSDTPKSIINIYERVKRYESRRRGILDGSPMSKISGLFHTDADLRKSSLIARLMQGKPPLVFPPPRSYSYPSYRYIENPDKIELGGMDAKDVNALIEPARRINDAWNGKNGEEADEAIIDQEFWKVIEIVSKNELLVTHGDWERLGYSWRLRKEAIHAGESERFMLCRNDGKRMTRFSQMVADFSTRLKIEREDSIIALDIDKSEREILRRATEKNGETSKFHEASERQHFMFLKEKIAQRTKNGLAELMSDEEIALSAKEKAESRIHPNGDMIVKDDDIFWIVWTLQRISPNGEIPYEHYLDMSCGSAINKDLSQSQSDIFSLDTSTIEAESATTGSLADKAQASFNSRDF